LIHSSGESCSNVLQHLVFVALAVVWRSAEILTTIAALVAVDGHGRKSAGHVDASWSGGDGVKSKHSASVEEYFERVGVRIVE
jgi:hypothetical protein